MIAIVSRREMVTVIDNLNLDIDDVMNTKTKIEVLDVIKEMDGREKITIFNGIIIQKIDNSDDYLITCKDYTINNIIDALSKNEGGKMLLTDIANGTMSRDLF